MKKFNSLYNIISPVLFLILSMTVAGNTPGGHHHHLSGTINGNIPFEMNLTIAGDTLYGNYLVIREKYPPSKPGWPGGWNSIPLCGKRSSKGIYFIRENPWEAGAFFTGTFSADRVFSGEWRSADGLTRFPVMMKEISESSIIPFEVTFRDGHVSLVKKAGSPRAYYEYCILTPEKTVNSFINDSLQRIILSAFYGKPVRKVDPEMLLNSLEQSYSENYITENAEIYKQGTGMSFSWESVKYMDVVHNTVNLLSFFIEEYTFAGGAHGLQTRDYLNVDIRNGRVLTLKDVFSGDFEKELTGLITDKVKTNDNIPGDAKLSDHGYFVEEVKPTENFYLTSNGIGFYYNHYEIAPYSDGPEDVFLTFAELKGLPLNETVRK